MFRLILKRLLLLIPVLIGVTFLVFSILSLAPGDPVLVVLGDNATEEAAEAMRSELGLDKPFLERYVNYIWDLLHGDFGKSYKTKLSVSDQILSRFPNTILLALSSMLIALLFGIPLGILSAQQQYTLLDNVASVGGLISVSMPNFWLGLLLVILFALKLRWLPSQGMGEDTGSMLKSLILPAVTLGTGIMATIMRMTRSSVLETMRQDYVSTARAKGISESQVTTRHMLKNALIPIITSAGLQRVICEIRERIGCKIQRRLSAVDAAERRVQRHRLKFVRPVRAHRLGQPLRRGQNRLLPPVDVRPVIAPQRQHIRQADGLCIVHTVREFLYKLFVIKRRIAVLFRQKVIFVWDCREINFRVRPLQIPLIDKAEPRQRMFH